MTITQMISLFDLVEDKSDTIYFTDNEKVEFLNASQNLLVETIVFSRDENSGLDANKQVEDILYPLRKKDIIIQPAVVGGNPTIAELNTASGGTIMHVEAVKVETFTISDVYKPARWIREGERDANADNTFRAPSATFDALSVQTGITNPQYSMDSAGLFIEPTLDDAGIGAKVKVSTLKFPTAMVNPGTDSDLPKGVHEKIVAGALAIAGIASDDDALLMFSQLTR